MIRHFLKLVWNRKRSTLLLILEIMIAFLVVVVVATAGTFFFNGYSQPTGFNHEDVWNISVDMKVMSDDTWTEEQSTRMSNLLREARSIDGVESAAVAALHPFPEGTMSGNWQIRGRSVQLEFNEVTDDYARVLGMNVVRGRWFNTSDDALSWRPVVLDSDAAATIYGDEDPIGKVFDKEANPPSRVVGVIDEYRGDGELGLDSNYIFQRTKLGDVKSRPGRNIIVKTRAGSGLEFEETLQRRLAPVAGDWSLEVRPLSDIRAAKFRMLLSPVITGGIIAVFLILMVIFGLSGVLWQNVTQRRSELGLRRAIGATAGQVRNQVLIELLIIASFGIVLGLVLVAQIPLLGLLQLVGIPMEIFIGGVIAAMTLMYLFTIVSGLYPSWMATRIEPATALRAD